MASSQRSRETYTQKIVLLLLPVVGVIALRGLTFLRHPSAGTTTADTQKAQAPVGSDKEAALVNMKKHLTEAIAAMNVGDFAKAKEHYNEFHSVWVPLEDSFKALSQSNYDKVEERMAEIKANLTETTKSSKNQVIDSLRLLIKTLDDYDNALSSHRLPRA